PRVQRRWVSGYVQLADTEWWSIQVGNSGFWFSTTAPHDVFAMLYLVFIKRWPVSREHGARYVDGMAGLPGENRRTRYRDRPEGYVPQQPCLGRQDRDRTVWPYRPNWPQGQ